MGRELARQNGACWRCAKRVVDGCKKSGSLRASKKCVFLKKGAIWKEKKYWKVLNNGKLKPRLNFTNWRRNLWRRQAATQASCSNTPYVRPLLALASDKVEREDGLCLRRFKDNRDNRDNSFPCLQADTGRRNGLSLLSLLSLKKTRGRKTTLLFCFLFSVSCVFYITGFFQLYFIYWLLPIILYFSPIVFIQLP